jgi:hypothetical protein
MKGFFAYPSQPSEIGEGIKSAIHSLKSGGGDVIVDTWEENDVAGRFIVESILEEIEGSDFVAADVTNLNFNVTYEIGYAIGKSKRTLLFRSSAVHGDDDIVKELGIFDTLGYIQYQNSRHIADRLRSLNSVNPIFIDNNKVNNKSPIYIVYPKNRTDFEITLTSKIKRARLQFRSYDPDEHGRMSARDAISNVAMSHGVIVPLLPSTRTDALVHNQRAAFVAGLASGLEKELLLLQMGNDPVPLDYRDLVRRPANHKHISNYIGEFASIITDRLQLGVSTPILRPKSFLASLDLGASSAENEMQELGYYYLETDEYRRALRGEAQVIAGRKGAGKTAIFVQIRDKLRPHKQTIVLDLKPQGFQLIKFKETVLSQLEQGTKEHTITAFWEYLLLLETCYKILEKDKEPHLRNHHLYEPYRALANAYREDPFISEGDFSERISKLLNRIADDLEKAIGEGDRKRSFSKGELTGLLYKHDTSYLRNRIYKYLKFKSGLWILFDNLDKGWPPHGLTSDDLIIIRCLLDAISKMERFLRHHDRNIDCHGIVFLRNDVYELLLENTSDRGKITRIAIDWTDADLLRELLRKRIVSSGGNSNLGFDAIWGGICVSHYNGAESSSYLIERSLMRPRCLIDLVQACKSHAVNLNHTRIESSDIKQGEESYSADLVANINLEMRDVYPEASDILYAFIERSAFIDSIELAELLHKAGLDEQQSAKVTDLMLWNGFLGIVRGDDEVNYIYDMQYDRKRMKALMNKHFGSSLGFHINPAFWAGLEIQQE